jgi:hypothetical protein
MGIADYKAEAITPSSPPSGYLRLFTDGSSWKYITSAGSVFTLSSGVTAEEVQDIVGAFFADSSTIDVTYNDAGDVISAVVVASAVNHNLLLNYVANQHVDHSAVSIITSTGLSGGGDLTSTRTFVNTDTGSSAVSTHVGLSNPHTQYLQTSVATSTYQPINGDLTAVAALATTGFITRTATNTVTTRTITAGTGVSLSNGDGISGNPTVTNTDLGSTAVTTHVSLADPHTQYELKANLGADVRSTVLTGFAVGSNVAIVATDSTLTAFKNIQAQINQIKLDASVWKALITTADIIVSSNNTLSNVTELQFTAVTGKTYYLEYNIKFRTASAATGIALTLATTTTAVGTIAAQVNIPIAVDGTAALYTGSISALADVVTSPSVPNTDWFIANIKGAFICTTGGVILPQFRSEVNNSNVTFGAGSIALIREF